jgi:DTW domain-containing protein YfiP
VVVLQHPREARVAKSTGSLLPLALDNARLLRGEALDLALQPVLDGGGPGRLGLLFPEGATPITEAPATLSCLLVPDGSWAQVRRILAASPRLARVPRYALPPGSEGDYRIRKPQGPGRLSTLEATVAALRILEGASGAYEAALALQQALVQQQVERMRLGGARHPAIGSGRWGVRGPRK